MCGIIGKIDTEKSINKEEFIAQRDIMINRGPDNHGVLFLNCDQIALGFRRLSIIDLSSNANQPLSNETNTVYILCNGEIYNYKELKSSLTKLGHFFKTSSDIEAVLHGYEEWGYDVLNRLVGMFAFAIYDSNKRIFFIARDRFGVKPLYYLKTFKKFMFSSSLKSLSIEKDVDIKINPESIINYLVYRYVPSPDSIYTHCSKIEPAHYLIVDEKLNLSKVCYWKLNYSALKIDLSSAVSRAGELLQQSVSCHLESDVPVGSFLSGGFDSSAIVTIMKSLGYNPTTFSIGFKDWDNSEHKYAQLLTENLNIENKIKMLESNGDFLSNEIINSLDEPIADISIIPTYYVSKLASKYVKAVFSGEGADELFGGYDWYYKSYRSIQSKPFINRIFQSDKKTAFNIYCEYAEMGKFSKDLIKKIISPEYWSFIPDSPFWFYQKHLDTSLPLPKMLQYLDIKTFMAELVLVKIDRLSMSNSLEARVPFLDHRLAEFLFSLHPSVYFNPKFLKFILYKIIEEKVPKEIISREKQGFVGPDKYYNNTNYYINELEDKKGVFYNYFSKNFLSSNLSNFNQWHLWKLFILKKWMNLNYK